jgi:ornithine cyclodeaminase
MHLSDAQIEHLVDVKQALPVLEEAFRDMARNRAATQRRVRTEAGGVKLSTLGAVLPEAGVAGAKIYTTIKGQFNFSIVLFSTRDGSLLATMDANTLTRIRTAATTVLAIRALATAGATTAAIFGTGVQGVAHAYALAEHTRLRSLRIVGQEGVEKLVHELNARFSGGGLVACAAEAPGALDGADVIVTATRATSALFPGSAVAAGALVTAIGSSLPHTRELDDALLQRASRIVVEMRSQAREEAGDLLLARDGVFNWDDVCELGEVLEQQRPGRTSRHDVIVYKAVGIGLQDIALAGLAYRNFMAGNATIAR